MLTQTAHAYRLLITIGFIRPLTRGNLNGATFEAYLGSIAPHPCWADGMCGRASIRSAVHAHAMRRGLADSHLIQGHVNETASHQ